MSMTALFIVVFLGAAGYGALRSQIQLRRIMAKRDYEDIIFEWFDSLPEGPTNEGLIWFAPLIHFLVVSWIALMASLSIPHQALTLDPSSLSRLVASFPHNFLAACSISLIAFLWGSILPINPFCNPFLKEGYYAISSQGLLYGGQLFPWSRFTHFTVDYVRGVSRLFSATSPGLIIFALLPVEPGDRSKLEEILSQHLPTAPPKPSPGSWSKWLLLAITVGAAIIVVLGSWVLLPRSNLFALPGAAILTYLYVVLGGRIMMRLGVGGMGLSTGQSQG
jgi:hypothetical protein